MFRKQTMIGRSQMGFYSLEDLVPQDHLLRHIDQYVDFEFIYDLVRDKYSLEHGRPSLDPVMLIKLPIIQYLFGIQSMRQTIKEIEVNVAYRWFLGLDFQDEVPHFTTFGKNYSRRFKDTDLFEQIFYRILDQVFEAKLVEPRLVYLDGTHIKAHANRHQFVNQEVAVEALIYQEALEKEINEVRVKAGKKPFKKSEEKTSKTLKYPRQIVIVVGFIKVNIRRSLLIQHRLPAIRTVGCWVTQQIVVIFTIVGLFLICMLN